jgi:hypothetical protein
MEVLARTLHAAAGGCRWHHRDWPHRIARGEFDRVPRMDERICRDNSQFDLFARRGPIVRCLPFFISSCQSRTRLGTVVFHSQQRVMLRRMRVGRRHWKGYPHMNGKPESDGSASRRKMLWAVFWFVCLTTPAALISYPLLQEHIPQLDLFDDYGLIETGSTLLAGSFLAALIFAKLRSETRAEFIWRTVGWSLVFAIFFAGVSFAGCAAIHRL